MVFNKNKKEDEGDPLAEGVETAGASVRTPEKKQSGISRLLSCLPGSRVLTPLILATSIGTQVQTAMARETHSQYASLASSMSTDHVERDKAPSSEEISTYFENYKSSIFKKLEASNDDKKTVREIKQAIELLANNNRTHSVIITSGELGHKALAQYKALTHTITIPENFDLSNIADQNDLIHEVVHDIQNGRIVTKSEDDSALAARYDTFIHSKGPIAVPKEEQKAMEAGIIFVNAMTDGALEKAVNDYEDFFEYKAQAIKILRRFGATEKESLNTLVVRAFSFYGMKAQWPYYVEHLYGCKVGATLHTESLELIGKLSKPECKTLKANSGIQ